MLPSNINHIICIMPTIPRHKCYHHLFKNRKSSYIAQAHLKLLGSSNLLLSAFPVVETTDMSYCTQLSPSFDYAGTLGTEKHSDNVSEVTPWRRKQAEIFNQCDSKTCPPATLDSKGNLNKRCNENKNTEVSLCFLMASYNMTKYAMSSFSLKRWNQQTRDALQFSGEKSASSVVCNCYLFIQKLFQLIKDRRMGQYL